MKKRLGFVSNSSSSSFVCDVCGHDAHGWDISLSEAEMYECENGHTFCRDEVIDVAPEVIIKYLRDDKEWSLPDDVEDYTDLEDFHEVDDFEYYIPECCCPICTFSVYAESDMKDYMQKKYGTSEDDAFAEVKALNKRRKKLYDTEYITYVCKVENTTVDKEFEELKAFGTYSEFKKYLRS